MDYIEALKLCMLCVFGRVEKLPNLMYHLEHTHQCKGERLLDYITRLDLILQQIILKKGIEPCGVDKISLE